MPERPVLAYLTSFYPHATDTFIRNEVKSMRAMGFTVHPFSVRRPPMSMTVSDEIREERERTTYLLSGMVSLVFYGMFALLRFPSRLFPAALLAYRSGGAGIKVRVWQTAYLLQAAILAQHLKKRGVQHLHNHIGANSATVAMLASCLSRIPYSMTVHGAGDFEHPLAIIGLRQKIERAAFVVAVTHHGRSQLYRYCGHEHWKKIHVVRCGVEDRFLGGAAVPIPSAPRLVCIGRISEQKGHLLLVEAAARLKRQGMDFEIALVGDGPMRGEIEQLSAKLGVAENVKVLGWMDSDQVKQQILASRAMVLPSFAEGLPVVIMEALALGRPVISTYIAGIPELVEPGRNGWLVPAGSVDDLVEAMREALEAPVEKLQAMGRHGARRVAERHCLATEAAKLAELFAAAAGKALPGPTAQDASLAQGVQAA